MQRLSNHKTVKDFLLYTGFFVILALSIFLAMFAARQSLIWDEDGLTQHYVILHNFNEILRAFFAGPGRGLPMFSFHMGLGQDVIGQYASYILGDPFAYLSLLFPMAKLELAYILLIFVRMYCVGAAFLIFAKYMKLNPKNLVTGALIYAFSGFMLYAGVRHPYFLNAAILFPFLLIAMEKLLREGKMLLLTILAFVSLLVNFYFFYMLAILVILYGIIKFILEYRKEGLRAFFRFLLKIWLSYFIGILMASVLFFPVLYAFSNAGRIDPAIIAGYPGYYYGALIDGFVTVQPASWSVYSVSSLILLMFPLLVKNRKRQKTVFLYTAILFLILLVPQAGSLMNGFSYPTNRWSFAFAFMLAYVIVLFLDPDFQYDRSDRKWMFRAWAGYSALVIAGNAIAYQTALPAMITMVLLALAMFAVIRFHEPIRARIRPGILLMALILVSLSAVGYFLFHVGAGRYSEQFLKYGAVEQDYNTMEGSIPGLKSAIAATKADPGLYRIAEYPESLENLSLYFNTLGISDYLSVGSKYEALLAKELANREYSISNNIKQFDNRAKITPLLGVKYYIVPETEKAAVPYGFTLFKTIPDPRSGVNTFIYRNPYTPGLSAFYDTYLPAGEYAGLSPLGKEDSLIHNAALAKAPAGFHIAKGRGNEAAVPVRYTIRDPNHLFTSARQAVITREGQSVSLTIPGVSDSELYVLLQGVSFHPPKGVSNTQFTIAAANGSLRKEMGLRDKASAYYFANDYFLCNLGYVKKGGGPLTLEFETKGTYTFSKLQVLAVSMRDYKADMAKLIRDNLKITHYSGNSIEGTISNTKDGILQITTPYSKGWTAYVDGRKTETLHVNTAFIGVPLKAGTHQVKFVYATPYLKEGAVASAFGVIAFILLFVWERKRNGSFR